MKKAVAVFAMLLVAGVSPVVANDGQVSGDTLAAMGLGDLQVISDVDGMDVRGMSSSAMSMGSSLVFGQIIDPATKSFIVGSDINQAGATAENAGKYVHSSVNHLQSSSLALQLDVATLTSVFGGSLIGFAGGSGAAFGH